MCTVTSLTVSLHLHLSWKLDKVSITNEFSWAERAKLRDIPNHYTMHWQVREAIFLLYVGNKYPPYSDHWAMHHRTWLIWAESIFRTWWPIFYYSGSLSAHNRNKNEIIKYMNIWERCINCIWTARMNVANEFSGQWKVKECSERSIGPLLCAERQTGLSKTAWRGNAQGREGKRLGMSSHHDWPTGCVSKNLMLRILTVKKHLKNRFKTH